MTWKRFQWVIWALLALCGGGLLLLFLISFKGFLVIGQVDGGEMICTLLLVLLLALLAWGDGAIVHFLRGWERVVSLLFVLAVEGLFLFTLWFFCFYFNTGPEYIPLYGPAGEVGLVVCEEGWLFKCWGEFYRPDGPFLLQDTGVTYEAHDSWPFRMGYYELEWEGSQVVVQYDTGAGWDSLTVPLD